MFTVALVAVAFSVLVVGFHVACLRVLARWMSRLGRWPVLGPALILVAAITAHLTEIGVYALAYGLLSASGLYGGIGKNPPPGALYYFFVSAETYTALGYSDNAPTGPLRVLAAFEALTGLVLITWTASLGYAAFQTFREDSRADAGPPERRWM